MIRQCYAYENHILNLLLKTIILNCVPRNKILISFAFLRAIQVFSPFVCVRDLKVF